MDGIVYVTLIDNVTRQVILQEEVTTGVTQDKRQLVEIAQRVDQTIESQEVQRTEVSSTTRDPQVLLLLQQARQKVMPFLDDAQASRIAGLVAALEAAVGESEMAAASEALSAELRKYSYLL